MISIIIPTYNSESTIRRCLDSIVMQEYQQWEVLLMDACSVDKTRDIATSYHDDRIFIHSKPDKGIYDAMNKGIKCAHGDWLYFLGSDDYLYDSKVLQYVANEFSNQYDVVYGDVFAPQLSQEYNGEWQIGLLNFNRCHQAIFYSRKIFNLLGLYNLKYAIYADYDFNLKWFLDERVKSKYINRIIANFSDGGISSIANDNLFWQDYEWNILKRGRRYFTHSENQKMLQRVVNIAQKNNMVIRYVILRIFKYFYCKYYIK